MSTGENYLNKMANKVSNYLSNGNSAAPIDKSDPRQPAASDGANEITASEGMLSSLQTTYANIMKAATPAAAPTQKTPSPNVSYMTTLRLLNDSMDGVKSRYNARVDQAKKQYEAYQQQVGVPPSPTKPETIAFEPLDFSKTCLAQIIPANPAGKLTLLQQMLKDAEPDGFCTEAIKGLNELFEGTGLQTFRSKYKQFPEVKQYVDSCTPFIKQGVVMVEFLQTLQKRLSENEDRYKNLMIKTSELIQLYQTKFPTCAAQYTAKSLPPFVLSNTEVARIEGHSGYTGPNGTPPSRQEGEVPESLTTFLNHFNALLAIHTGYFYLKDMQVTFNIIESNLPLTSNTTVTWGSGDDAFKCQMPTDAFFNHFRRHRVAHALRLMNQPDAVLTQDAAEMCPGLPRLSLEQYTRWRVAAWLLNVDFSQDAAADYFIKTNVAGFVNEITEKGGSEAEVVGYIEQAIRTYANGAEKLCVEASHRKRLIEKLYEHYSVLATNQRKPELAQNYSVKALNTGTVHNVPKATPTKHFEFLLTGASYVDATGSLSFTLKTLICSGILDTMPPERRDVIWYAFLNMMGDKIEKLKVGSAANWATDRYVEQGLGHPMTAIDAFLNAQQIDPVAASQNVNLQTPSRSSRASKYSPVIQDPVIKKNAANNGDSGSLESQPIQAVLNNVEYNPTMLSMILGDSDVSHVDQAAAARLLAEQNAKTEARNKANKRWASLNRLHDAAKALSNDQQMLGEDWQKINALIDHGDGDIKTYLEQMNDTSAINAESIKYKDARRQFRATVYLPLAKTAAENAKALLGKNKIALSEAAAALTAVGGHAPETIPKLTEDVAMQLEKPIPETSRKQFDQYLKHTQNFQSILETTIQGLQEQRVAKLQTIMVELSPKIDEIVRTIEGIVKRLSMPDARYARSLIGGSYTKVPDYDPVACAADEANKLAYIKICDEKMSYLKGINDFLDKNDKAITEVSRNTYTSLSVHLDLSGVDTAQKALEEAYVDACGLCSTLNDEMTGQYEKASFFEKLSLIFSDSENKQKLKKAEQDKRVLHMMLTMDEKMPLKEKESRAFLVDDSLTGLARLTLHKAILTQEINGLWFFQWEQKAFYEQVRVKLESHIEQLKLLKGLNKVNATQDESARAELISTLTTQQSLEPQVGMYENFKKALSALKEQFVSFMDIVNKKNALKTAWESIQNASSPEKQPTLTQGLKNKTTVIDSSAASSASTSAPSTTVYSALITSSKLDQHTPVSSMNVR